MSSSHRNIQTISVIAILLISMIAITAYTTVSATTVSENNRPLDISHPVTPNGENENQAIPQTVTFVSQSNDFNIQIINEHGPFTQPNELLAFKNGPVFSVFTLEDPSCSEANPCGFQFRINQGEINETVSTVKWTTPLMEFEIAFNTSEFGFDQTKNGKWKIYTSSTFEDPTWNFLATEDIQILSPHFNSGFQTTLYPREFDINLEKEETRQLRWGVTMPASEASYIIYAGPNGTAIFSESLILEQGITTGFLQLDYNGSLEPGNYNFRVTLQLNESFSPNFYVLSHNLTITEPVAPVLSEAPADLTITAEESSTLSWTANDASNGTYTVSVNSELQDSGSWSSGTSVAYILDGSSGPGEYDVTIEFTDVFDLATSDTVRVTVTEGVAPALSDSPDDATLQASESLVLSWTANDEFPDTYTVTVNSELQNSSSWTSGTPVTYTLDGSLDPGEYTVTIEFADVSGLMTPDSVSITVLAPPMDTQAPDLLKAADKTFEFGITGQSLMWTLGDTNPGAYFIVEQKGDGDLITVEDGAWTNGTIVYLLDGLDIGTYTYQFTAFDASANRVDDTVLVTVTADITSPMLSGDIPPGTLEVERGSQGAKIAWTASDAKPGVYNVLVGDTNVSLGSWSSGIPVIVDVATSTSGEFNYSVTFYDVAGNSVSHIVIITIVENLAPVIAPATDFSYNLGSTGNVLSWAAVDAGPSNYSVSRNGTTVSSGNWVSGNPISVNVDGHDIGSYTYILTVFDNDGLSSTDEVIITVVPVGSSTQAAGFVSFVDNLGLILIISSVLVAVPVVTRLRK